MQSRYLFFVLLLALLASCHKPDPTPDPSSAARTYIILSDIHLGDSRAVREGYGWNNQMIDTLAAFLDYLAGDSSWDELIIAGDLVDEWTVPAEVVTMRDDSGNTISESAFFQKLVTDNQPIFDRFRRLKDSGRKLVYVPGNHDMLVTAADFDQSLAGLFDQARTSGVVGMGEYCPDSNIFIEHGHRYDIINAPYVGKCGVDGIPDGSILPPGFFECRLHTSHREETITRGGLLPLLDGITYNLLWTALGVMYGQRDVVTMIDGMTKTYSFDQYAGSEAPLFYHIDQSDRSVDGWSARCIRNKACYVPSVTVSILSGFLYDYCDQMGQQVLASGTMDARILVWGHSHSPKLLTDGKGRDKTIYLNVGCWVDAERAGAECTSTYGKVVAKANHTYEVSLSRFDLDADGTPMITILGCEQLPAGN